MGKISGKYRFKIINRDGISVTPISGNNSFDILGQFSGPSIERTILVKNDSGKFGIFNLNGDQLVDFIYDEVIWAHPYNNYGSVQAKLNGKWGIINSIGEVLLDFKYDLLGSFPHPSKSSGAHLIPIIQYGCWGMLNEEYKLVIPIKYENISFWKSCDYVSASDDLIWPAKFKNKFGYINNKNEIKIPFIFEDASKFENGIAEVKLNRRIGSIDKEGKKYW